MTSQLTKASHNPPIWSKHLFWQAPRKVRRKVELIKPGNRDGAAGEFAACAGACASVVMGARRSGPDKLFKSARIIDSGGGWMLAECGKRTSGGPMQMLAFRTLGAFRNLVKDGCFP